MEKMKELFDRLGVKIEFHRVERHPNGGAQGCFESHVEVIKQAYDEGCQNCLIFEDDIETTSALTPKALRTCINFMKGASTLDSLSEDASKNENEGKGWDLFYLGIYPDLGLNRIEYVTDEIIRLHTFNTHAYVISRPFMEKMKDQQYVGVQIDSLYKYNENAYSYYRSLFIQDQLDSDIEHSNFGTSWFRKKLAYATEVYAYYYNVPTIITGAFLFLLLFLVVLARPHDFYYFYPLLCLFILLFIVFFKNIRFNLL